MNAKQRMIQKNEAELEKLRKQLGIMPKMHIISFSSIPAKSTFNLWELNKELITKKQ